VRAVHDQLCQAESGLPLACGRARTEKGGVPILVKEPLKNVSLFRNILRGNW
jgi:hypothetical protein